MCLFILHLVHYYGTDIDYYLQGYYLYERRVVVKILDLCHPHVLSVRAWVSYSKPQFTICEMV